MAEGTVALGWAFGTGCGCPPPRVGWGQGRRGSFLPAPPAIYPVSTSVKRYWLWLAGVAAVGAALLAAGMDPRAGSLLGNTGMLVAYTLAICLPAGTFLAWLIARTDVAGRPIAVVLIAGLFVPLFVHAGAWQAGFGLLGWHTQLGQSPPWLRGLAGAAWVHAMAALPWVVLAVALGLRLVEPELEEQALLDASGAKVFFRITARAAASAGVLIALWVAVYTAGEITATDLFQVRTYAEEVYTALTVGSLEESAASLGPGLALMACLALGGLFLAVRLGTADRPLSVRSCRVFPLGMARWPLAAAALLILVLWAGVPLGNLVYQAGVEVTLAPAGRTRSWSLTKAAGMVLQSPWRFRREFGWSLLLGGLAAATATALAAGLAGWGRRRWIGQAASLLVVVPALVIPGPLLALATMRLLSQPGWPWLDWLYDQSVLAPWMVLSLRATGPAMLVLWHAMGSVPQGLLDAAAVDGAGPWRRFFGVLLPIRWPALALAWLVALAVSMADLAASVLVVPPGVTTLSIRVFGLLHYGVYDQVAGICLALVGWFGLLGIAAAWTAAMLHRRWT